MSIQHEILSFDANNGAVLVRYFTESNPNAYIYNVDVPMIDGKYVSEEELTAHIEHLAPKAQLERVEQIANAEVPKYLNDIVNKNQIAMQNENDLILQAEAENNAFNQRVIAVLINEGLVK